MFSKDKIENNFDLRWVQASGAQDKVYSKQ